MSTQVVGSDSISRQLQLLSTLKRVSFSGRLIWKKGAEPNWILFFSAGKIVYATGGQQPTRRWYRHLYQQCPVLATDFRRLQQQLIAVEKPLLPRCPDYQILHDWVESDMLSTEQLRQVVEAIASEVTFDATQESGDYELKRTKPAPISPEQLVDSDIVTYNVGQLWQRWRAADLPNYRLSQIPIIRQPESLRTSTPAQTYQMLSAIIDGKRTLWDIAGKTRRDAVQIVKPLQPYLEAGWIELVERQGETTQTSPPVWSQPGKARSTTPVIACVDDSLMVCQSLEKIIRSSGYEFIGILEASRAIAILLRRKPAIIFLDLIMPETNGYEICSQLRKTTQFKETPIIILTGNDGVVDQVRARLMGATDFISKPADPAIISNIIHKYLPDGPPE